MKPVTRENHLLSSAWGNLIPAGSCLGKDSCLGFPAAGSVGLTRDRIQLRVCGSGTDRYYRQGPFYPKSRVRDHMWLRKSSFFFFFFKPEAFLVIKTQGFVVLFRIVCDLSQYVCQVRESLSEHVCV